MKFSVNGRPVETTVAGQTPLLWVLRENLGLTGTKYGCGLGLCGACTVHLDGAAVRSCQLPAEAAVGHEITTIEGLASGAELHPLQRAWVEHDVVQCGYCQSGQLMSAAALLHQHPHPTAAELDEGMGGNICRCGTYERIRAAIKSAAGASNTTETRP